MSLLTTITPYWGRPESLKVWQQAIAGSTLPEVRHIVYFVGESIPEWWHKTPMPMNILAIHVKDRPGASIGHYHNMGAEQASTEWIMKFDVDAIPNQRYFHELIYVLRSAREREWFNCGMMFMSQASSEANLSLGRMPLTTDSYMRIMLEPKRHSKGSFAMPEASNFCCRRIDYLRLGGADPRFRNWGWEDYQQLYMLERYWRGKDPLPGIVDISNVTQRCRDEIARPKARELFYKNRWLCLLHRWHPPSETPGYKTQQQSQINREIVLENILKNR